MLKASRWAEKRGGRFSGGRLLHRELSVCPDLRNRKMGEITRHGVEEQVTGEKKWLSGQIERMCWTRLGQTNLLAIGEQ